MENRYKIICMLIWISQKPIIIVIFIECSVQSESGIVDLIAVTSYEQYKHSEI